VRADQFIDVLVRHDGGHHGDAQDDERRGSPDDPVGGSNSRVVDV
jgi:hypothetical protein